MSVPALLTVVGTGAFVTSDAYGPGVVARSLGQWCAEQAAKGPWQIAFLYRSPEGQQRIMKAWSEIEQSASNLPSPLWIPCDSSEAEAAIARSHALFVCVPDDAHAAYINTAIRHKTPTWVVKPLTARGSVSKELVFRSEDTGVPIWVDYHKRFDVSNRHLRSEIDKGRHGKPRLYSVRYSQPRDLPLDGFAWTAETDVFSYIGCHYVDQLLYLLPEIDIKNINAQGISGPVHERFGGLAWDRVLARFDAIWRGHSLSAHFEVGWSNPLGTPTKSHQIAEMAFDRGKIFLDQTHRGIETWTDDGVAIPNPHFFSQVYDPLTQSHTYQGYGYDSIRHFLDWTIASQEDQERALANDALPWARSAARVDALLDRVRAALSKTSGT